MPTTAAPPLPPSPPLALPDASRLCHHRHRRRRCPQLPARRPFPAQRRSHCHRDLLHRRRLGQTAPPADCRAQGQPGHRCPRCRRLGPPATQRRRCRRCQSAPRPPGAPGRRCRRCRSAGHRCRRAVRQDAVNAVTDQRTTGADQTQQRPLGLNSARLGSPTAAVAKVVGPPPVAAVEKVVDPEPPPDAVRAARAMVAQRRVNWTARRHWCFCRRQRLRRHHRWRERRPNLQRRRARRTGPVSMRPLLTSCLASRRRQCSRRWIPDERYLSCR